MKIGTITPVRRPIQTRVLTFLAESEEGLDQLIRQNTKHERVLKVDKNLPKPHVLFGAHVARVTVLI